MPHKKEKLIIIQAKAREFDLKTDIINNLRMREKTADKLIDFETRSGTPTKRAFQEGKASAFFLAIDVVKNTKSKKYWK